MPTLSSDSDLGALATSADSSVPNIPDNASAKTSLGYISTFSFGTSATLTGFYSGFFST
jgi:hypothetical protein